MIEINLIPSLSYFSIFITFLFLDEEESIPADGKILFKKPTKKREAEEDSNTEKSDKDKAKKKKKKDKKAEKQLLSFDEDEEES